MNEAEIEKLITRDEQMIEEIKLVAIKDFYETSNDVRSSIDRLLNITKLLIAVNIECMDEQLELTKSLLNRLRTAERYLKNKRAG